MRFDPHRSAPLESGPEELNDISGCSRQIDGVIAPATRKDALAAIVWARQNKLRLHPISRGNNWGFGSRLPVENKAHILNLSNLRTVRLHLDQDFAEVEPGVTQGDLYDALVKAGDSHFFNVTGAGRETSVVGNALERGIGYFGSKKDDLLDLEVAAANGDSFWSKDQRNPHHPGLGPDLTGAFLQSGWGVVINSKIRLRKRPPYMAALVMQLQPGAPASAYFDQIALLCRENLISSVPHVANRQRMICTFGPHLSASQMKEFERSAPEWSCMAPVSGTRATIGSLIDVVRDRMKDIAICSLLDTETGKAQPILAPALDLALGRPNDFALPGVAFSVFQTKQSFTEDLDIGRAGLIHVVPTSPASSGPLSRLLDMIDRSRRSSEMPVLPLTVNYINSGTAAVIISVPFDRSHPESVNNARLFSKSLLQECILAGFPPYRLGLEDAAQLPSMNSCRRKLLRAFEQSIDPDGLVAPSRYHKSWREVTDVALDRLETEIHQPPLIEVVA